MVYDLLYGHKSPRRGQHEPELASQLQAELLQAVTHLN